jgi:hypothetical protein
MTQSKVLPAAIVFVVIEGINTVINIMPALKEPTVQGINKRLVRAGIINFILLAGFIFYLEMNK